MPRSKLIGLRLTDLEDRMLARAPDPRAEDVRRVIGRYFDLIDFSLIRSLSIRSFTADEWRVLYFVVLGEDKWEMPFAASLYVALDAFVHGDTGLGETIDRSRFMNKLAKLTDTEALSIIDAIERTVHAGTRRLSWEDKLLLVGVRFHKPHLDRPVKTDPSAAAAELASQSPEVFLERAEADS